MQYNSQTLEVPANMGFRMAKVRNPFKISIKSDIIIVCVFPELFYDIILVAGIKWRY